MTGTSPIQRRLFIEGVKQGECYCDRRCFWTYPDGYVMSIYAVCGLQDATRSQTSTFMPWFCMYTSVP
ncbi:hypothetical protein PILCRDRAFT_819684 [Piloderma croceum F 1598]|uniref:Uncharacterized protein n=1 Tax=Piloderma croceum (strain F 1598) TaxID=765440 RepID=A0A0C3FYT8_PILCF|nr:hypothetical protein PILCRDRAFT_819684 [Piloderma croceum F 1598]